MLFGTKKTAEQDTTKKPLGELGDAPHTATIANASQADLSTDGSGVNKTSPSPEDLHRRAVMAQRQSVDFSKIVSVLLRSQSHKFFTLADLEWLVIPPLVTGQFALAEAKQQEGMLSTPIGVVLWASVSAEVDQRLTQNIQAPIRLRPDEWRSGDVLWIVDAVGEGRVLSGLLKQLGERLWAGRKVRIRSLGPAGTVVASELSAIAS